MNSKKPSITSNQVAKLAGVSQSTVSRAFTPDSSVSEKARRRVLDAARKLGYQPNAMARSLITRRSNMVGIVIANVATNPFYPEVLDLLSRRFQDLGQKVMLFAVTRDQSLDDILPQLLEYQVEGILITAATLSSAMAGECERWGTPVTLFNRYVPGTSASSFCCDNVEGGRTVARLLIDAGHLHIAYLAGTEDTSTSVDREKGFQQILKKEGYGFLREFGNYTYKGAYEAAIRLLKRPDPADSIFCANDIMAMGAADAVRSGMGMSIPDDVSIIGFDDIPMAGWPSYNLTTIRQPVQRMVYDSVDDLISRINASEKTSQQQFIRGDLVIRGSARIPSGLSQGWVISQDLQN